MSSHYLVKEGQEPALIIGNGEACSISLLHALLEWSPLVVALDGAYHRIRDLGIKPDIVIGDFDSIKTSSRLPDVAYIQIDDQSTTDLEKGIDHLVSKGYDAINLVWVTGRRMDHTVNNIGTLARYPDKRIVIYDDLNKIYLLPKRFEKHYEKGDPISLIPIDEVSGIHTSGLKYNLNDEQLHPVNRSGSSNEAMRTGLVKISYTTGRLVMMESYDSGPLT